MHPQITFSFPIGTSPAEILSGIAAHYATAVPKVWSDAPLTVSALDNPEVGQQDPAAIFGARPVVSSEVIPDRDPAAVFAPIPVQAGIIAATPGAATPPTSGLEFDVTGLAWDERIHSGNRTKTPAGEWRSRKGVEKSVTTRVEAELRAKYPSAMAHVAVSPGTIPPSPGQLPPSIGNDPSETAQKHRLDYAHEKGIVAAGAVPMDNMVFLALKRGDQTVQLTLPQMQWWQSYQAANHAAYESYHAAAVAQHQQAGIAPQPAPPAIPPHVATSPGAGLARGVQLVVAISKARLGAQQVADTLKMAGFASFDDLTLPENDARLQSVVDVFSAYYETFKSPW